MLVLGPESERHPDWLGLSLLRLLLPIITVLLLLSVIPLMMVMVLLPFNR